MPPRGPQPTFPTTKAYTISINEYQRALIVKIMKAGAHVLHGELKEMPGDFEENAAKEMELFVKMAEGLPESEQKYPGVTHGFCL